MNKLLQCYLKSLAHIMPCIHGGASIILMSHGQCLWIGLDFRASQQLPLCTENNAHNIVTTLTKLDI